jgi:hypothetical protein
MEDVHRCHVERCITPVPPAMLMCTRHWRLVPYPMQREVWKHYRKGQEVDKRPTKEYLVAANTACNFVRDRELEIRRGNG